MHVLVVFGSVSLAFVAPLVCLPFHGWMGERDLFATGFMTCETTFGVSEIMSKTFVAKFSVNTAWWLVRSAPHATPVFLFYYFPFIQFFYCDYLSFLAGILTFRPPGFGSYFIRATAS